MLIQRKLKFTYIFVWSMLLLSLSLHVNCEFYSSVYEMTKLVQYEAKFLDYMQKLITDNENKLDFLKARLAEFEHEREELLDEGSDYFDSPVNKYLLTKHLTVDWERIKNTMQHKTGEKILERMDQYEFIRKFPNEDELSGALEGLLRLQDIYLLKTKDIAEGVLQGVPYNTKLEARHCFDIGKQAVKNEKVRLGHSWLVEALDRLNSSAVLDEDRDFEFVEEPLLRRDILPFLAEAKIELGDMKGADDTIVELLNLLPESEAAAKLHAVFTESVSDKDYASVDLSDEHGPLPEDLLKTPQDQRYKCTCAGLIKSSPSEERELRCGYLTETHPFLLLAPIKVEEMNHDPLLLVYHEVISDKEIEIMRNLTNNRITRAMIMGSDHSVVSPLRTSQFAFIPKTEHKLLQTIDQRVQDMTNLNMIYAEDHQFQNYGIGGHYCEHFDGFTIPREEFTDRVSSPEMGNRIATVLFYLTDVEQGGGTAYPYMKKLLLPKKGAAAFWYNLHASGEIDQRTLHGGCPIIVGSKWVLNRWIREYVQDDRRPCERYNDQYFGPL